MNLERRTRNPCAPSREQQPHSHTHERHSPGTARSCTVQRIRERHRELRALTRQEVDPFDRRRKEALADARNGVLRRRSGASSSGSFPPPTGEARAVPHRVPVTPRTLVTNASAGGRPSRVEDDTTMGASGSADRFTHSDPSLTTMLRTQQERRMRTPRGTRRRASGWGGHEMRASLGRSSQTDWMGPVPRSTRASTFRTPTADRKFVVKHLPISIVSMKWAPAEPRGPVSRTRGSERHWVGRGYSDAPTVHTTPLVPDSNDAPARTPTTTHTSQRIPEHHAVARCCERDGRVGKV